MSKEDQSPQIQKRIQKTFEDLGLLLQDLENDPLFDETEMLVQVQAPAEKPAAPTEEPSAALYTMEPKVEISAIVSQSVAVRSKRRARVITYQSSLALYLFGIVLAETLTTLYIPSAGVICHALLLAGLFIQSALTRSQKFRRILMTLSLAPLIRIVSLSLPLQDYVFYYWYMVVGAPLFLSAFLVARYTGFGPADIGLRFSGWFLQVLLGLFGIGLGYVEYLILRPAPLASALTLEQVWLPGLILIIFTGLLEEIIFRGLMQKAFIDGLGRLRGVLFVSIVFAALHLGYKSALDVLFVFIVALLFSVIALRSRSIVGVTVAHGLTNFCLFLVFPFLLN